ncbi:hypothetical protein TRFO_19123 [Tritrichomonas foetus]|uniref:XRN 5'-3' exonuclease N-terminus family protein n=1 Tax=Tritrichomonas foetus TaxID=1144522 RepID=A0A1J4KNW9_9EUKA|nr:hypothetical protein TRFO_19123 [Tritrichomonas foetus]|eukprot:OHT11398.1 hypothetical protein TRFO_19123 [Tritrichomonas foetus]
MGVDSFFHWIAERYPLSVRRYDDQSHPSFDILFIDFNAIIYYSMNIFNSNNQDLWFDEVCRTLDLIVHHTRPECLIYISADGTAPFAKNREQRKRRKRSNVFRSQITIATEFMEALHKKLLTFFEYKKINDFLWKKATLIYSSYKTPGEGEHKFFDFIRDLRRNHKFDENSIICLYSPDPDIILMCFQYNLKNSILMTYPDDYNNIPIQRETEGRLLSKSDFVLFYTNIIKEYILIEFPFVKENEIQNIIDVFTAMSFLIGNDFIPAFCDISLKKDYFSQVIQIYKENFEGFLVEGKSFNHKNLSKFLNNVFQSNLNNVTCLQSLKDSSEEFFDSLENRNMAKSIVESFYFVLRYYKDDLPSWTWQYPYDLSPPLKSVSDYLGKMADEEVPNFSKDKPLAPLEQLISILPPSCSSLVPESMIELLSEKTGIDNVNELQEKVKSKLNMLTKEELERNVKINDILIQEIGNVELTNFSQIREMNVSEQKVPSLYCISNKLNISFTGKLFFIDNTVSENVYPPNVIGKHILVDWPFFKLSIIVGTEDNNIHVRYLTSIEDGKENYSENVYKFSLNQISTKNIEYYTSRITTVISSKDDQIQLNEYLNKIKDNIIPSINIRKHIDNDRQYWKSSKELAFKYKLNQKILVQLISFILSIPQIDRGKEFLFKQLNNELLFSITVENLTDSLFCSSSDLLVSLQNVPNVEEMKLILKDDVSFNQWSHANKILCFLKSYEQTALDNSLPSLTTLNELEKELKQFYERNEKLKTKNNLSNIIFTNKNKSKFKCGDRVIFSSKYGIIPFGTIATFLSICKDAEYAICISDLELPYLGTLYNNVLTKRYFISSIHDLFLINI